MVASSCLKLRLSNHHQYFYLIHVNTSLDFTEQFLDGLSKRCKDFELHANEYAKLHIRGLTTQSS
jgi:hypothetical protein